MKIEIKSWMNGSILFSVEAANFKVALELAVKSRADLSRANLSRANLYGADLSRAKGIKDILQIGPIGSRKDYLIALKLEDDSIQIRAGCFVGTIKEFEDRVKETHKDNEHGKAYKLAMKLIQARMGK